MGYEIDFLGRYDAESLIAELRRIASVTGRPRVKSTDINRFGRVTYETVLRRFGSMRRANEAAGLMPGPVRSRSDEELLTMMAELWDRTLKENRRRPMKADVRKYGFPVNACTITARFGTWNQALLAANEMVERRERERPDGAQKDPQGRTSISLRTRFLVFKRDQYQCQICRKLGGELELDHVTPVALGGSDEVENLQTLCVACNRGKRDSLQ